ncbi:MAG: ABC transporter permease [Thermotogota bacterium]
MNKKFLAIKKVIFGYFRKSKKDFRFTMISVGIAIWGLIVITSVINGFDNVLINSITEFYPHILINGEHDIENKEVDYSYKLSFENALIIQPELKMVNVLKTSSLKHFSNNFLKEIENKNINYNVIGVGIEKYSENKMLRTITLNNFIPEIDNIEYDNVFKTKISTFDNNMILKKIDPSQKFEYTAIILKEPNKADQFKKKYLSEFSSLTWKESNKTLTQTIEIDSMISLLITFFIVLMASFSVSNSLTFSFLKRKREIGLLRITGFTWNQIKNIFLFESLITSLIGYIYGVFFSLFTVIILNLLKIPLPSGIFYIDYLPVKFDYKMMILSFFFTVIIVSIISIINLKRLMKFDHIEVLKDGE